MGVKFEVVGKKRKNMCGKSTHWEMYPLITCKVTSRVLRQNETVNFPVKGQNYPMEALSVNYL